MRNERYIDKTLTVNRWIYRCQ